MKRDLTKILIGKLYSNPPRKNYETNKTIIKFIDVTWSSGFLDMNKTPQIIKVLDVFLWYVITSSNMVGQFP